MWDFGTNYYFGRNEGFYTIYVKNVLQNTLICPSFGILQDIGIKQK